MALSSKVFVCHNDLWLPRVLGGLWWGPQQISTWRFLCMSEVVVLTSGPTPLLCLRSLSFPQFSTFLVMPGNLPGKCSAILELVMCA